jgi:hypothetical protein
LTHTPLPSSGKAWPPENLKAAYNQIQVFDAWYVGDEEALSWLYAINRLQTKTSVWGQVTRRFWGTPGPTTATQRPTKIHVPIAAEISRMSSQNLFGQMPDVHFGDMDGDDDDKGLTATVGKAATERLAEILDDSAHAELLKAAEYASAHGGTYLRVTWDQDVIPDRPFITSVAYDSAVPKFRHGRLVQVTFWSDLAAIDGRSFSYKLLELHAPGRIEWGLYESSSTDDLGVMVPITDHPDTAYLADIIDADGGIDTGSDLLTAVHVPNIAPNGAWRKDPAAVALGRSDYSGNEDLFDDLDETVTSLQREFRLGKARAMISKDLIDVKASGQGGTFNADQEFFTQTNAAVGSLNPGATGGTNATPSIMFMQPNLRTKEHLDKITWLTSRIYQAAGFSPQSFGDAGEVAITATEVNSREKLTTLTRGAKILYWRPQLAALFAALMDVDANVFSGPGRAEALPDVEWPDSETVNPKIVADTILSLVNAEAISLYERVAVQHSDWDPEQINAEVDKIREDYAMLPENKPGFLWAATAANGSATGGVDANSYGVKGVNTEGIDTSQAPRNAPDQAKGTDQLTPGPQPKGN